MSGPKIIVIGGGLSGLSAAHTVLERGGRVLLLDKSAFLGGNSTKATSGINGATTRTQIAKGVGDSVEAFLKDTVLSATGGKSTEPYPLAEVLVGESAAAVEWLKDSFKLDLSLLGRLGGHSFPRTHRGKERFPGFTITYALMEELERIEKKTPERARVITRARATKLLKDEATGEVTGVEYEHKGKKYTEHGPVIIATGGYGADFGDDSILMRHRPDLKSFSTTNGPHCTGDGIKMAQAVGAGLKDITFVQVHPTGLIMPSDPNCKVKYLAAEALRGVGGLLLDGNGRRFVNELGRRDYVSGKMRENKGPFRLVLNSAAKAEIDWHIKHYCSRGLMREFQSGADLAKDIGVPASQLAETFSTYNQVAKSKNDPHGKLYFANTPFNMNDKFYVGFVTPVVHYTMGGVYVSPASEVLTPEGKPIPALWATGEVMGGTHGKNRLGGSSLLDCVVFGRVAGRNAASYLMNKLVSSGGRAGKIAGHLAPGFKLDVSNGTVRIEISGLGAGAGSAGAGASSAGPSTSSPSGPHPDSAEAAAAADSGAPAKKEKKEYTMADVAKHNTDKDCWVVVNGEVLDVTSFLDDHPGGKAVIMIYAGKDASEEFNMLHARDVVEKYAPEIVIGTLKK